MATREGRIALAFKTEEGLQRCIEILLDERPEVPFDLPGRHDVIIPKTTQQWFEKRLAAEKHAFETVPVVPATAVSFQRLAELRAQYGKPAQPEYGDIEWKQKRIAEIKRLLGRS